jgi:hypothetical protein
MRLLVTHPEFAFGLVHALNETDCVAARTGSHTLEVFAPWLLEGGDPAHAATEVLFFVRAWASGHPEFRVRVLPGSRR